MWKYAGKITEWVASHFRKPKKKVPEFIHCYFNLKIQSEKTLEQFVAEQFPEWEILRADSMADGWIRVHVRRPYEHGLGQLPFPPPKEDSIPLVKTGEYLS